jgi:hypothetical protein
MLIIALIAIFKRVTRESGAGWVLGGAWGGVDESVL